MAGEPEEDVVEGGAAQPDVSQFDAFRVEQPERLGEGPSATGDGRDDRAALDLHLAH